MKKLCSVILYMLLGMVVLIVWQSPISGEFTSDMKDSFCSEYKNL
jgi:hypothetical protein